MTYKEARVYLDEMSKYGSVLGLDTIRGLLRELGNPQDDLKFIHIAGTNGKGSVLAYTSTILSEAGYRTGRYVSPTVVSYLEKIQVDGTWIAEEDFAELTEKVKEAIARMEAAGENLPTVFEAETAIAFLYFQKRNCDLVVLETGLGGATDATNIIKNTICAAFATISEDHLGVIGNNLEEIAETKSGIIKPGCQVVSARQKESVRAVLKRKIQSVALESSAQQVCEQQSSEQKSGERKCLSEIAENEKTQKDVQSVANFNVKDEVTERFTEAEPEKMQIRKEDLHGIEFSYKEFTEMKSTLVGQCQIENLATALEVIRCLRRLGYEISEEQVRSGLSKTRWPGRFTLLSEHPLFLIDGAHNEDAALKLKKTILRYLPGKRLTLIMGVFKDKEYEKITSILCPLAEKVYTVNLPNVGRTLSAEELAVCAKHWCDRTEAVGDIRAAVERAVREAEQDLKQETEQGENSDTTTASCAEKEEHAILACGSLSYLGEVSRMIEEIKLQ